eukprot:scaffold561_cov380-Pavlova_lutheri.AAC.10
MQAQLANLPARTFKVGDQVKVQYGLKGATGKHKLDPYYVGPFTIAEDLSNGAYKLHIPPNSPYSDRFNADRLALWSDSDLTLFHAPHDIGNSPARLPPDCRVEPTIAIRRYLLRDYRYFPHKPVRYWVPTDSAETPLEENNGCIPERGIIDENKEAVKTHKQQIYLQYPSPILVNTWTSARLPLQTRKRPAFKPPHILLNAIVQELFHISETNQAYYQGLVIKVKKQTCTIQWTDGHKSQHTQAEVRSMLYDPKPGECSTAVLGQGPFEPLTLPR